MTTKQDMLNQIRHALGRSGARTGAPTPPAVPDDLVRLCHASDDLPGVFTEHAVAVGMEVERCAARDVPSIVLRILSDVNAVNVACSVDQLVQPLTHAGITLVNWHHDPSLSGLFDADASVTRVHAALAETGTLVCDGDAQHARGLSLVPPLHIAIVYHRDILPDMLDMMRCDTSPPSGEALITGPSKTADIEGVLVRGVHGPGRVVVVLVDDE